MVSETSSPESRQARAAAQKERLLQPPRLTILGDQPISKGDIGTDCFDLAGRIGPIYDILRHPETPTPMAVAIYGDWGAGKTSAMRWLDGRLEAWREESKFDKKKITAWSAWFHPWKYQSEEDVWRGLIAEVIIACIEAEKARRAEDAEGSHEVYVKAIERFGVFLGKSFVSVIAGTKLSIGLPEVAKLSVDGQQTLNEITKQVEDFASPQNAYLNGFEVALRSWIHEKLGETERLVVFIDDLDRCLPEVALQVLEALKLYLDVANLIFVVGVDREVVDGLVRRHYEDLGLGPKKSGNYLAKMFSVEVTLAPSDPQIDEFLDGLLDQNEAWTSLKDKELFRRLIRKLATRSPREVKRLVNSSLMAGAGARLSLPDDDPEKLALAISQGIQVFLVRRVLNERYTRASLVGQNRGTRFFRAWSGILQDDEPISLTVKVPTGYGERLQALRDEQDRQRSADTELDADRELDEALSDIPKRYHRILKDRSFTDLFELLQDADLGSLMRIPYPTEAAAISSELGGGADAQIIGEAIARQLNETPERVVAADYEQVGELDLSSQEIADLAPLRTLVNLRTLSLRVNRGVSDLEPVRRLAALEELDIRETNVEDLGPLRDLVALRRLLLANTPVSELEPLRGLAALQELDLRNTQAKALGPLKDLVALQRLVLANTPVSELEPLKGLSALQQLDLRYAQVKDLKPLEHLTALEGLFLANTVVSELEPLRGLGALRELDLGHTQVLDLSPLKGLPALQSLRLAAMVGSLDALRGLTALTKLSLANRGQIKSLEPLRDLTALRELNLFGTQVGSLEPLASLTALEELKLRHSGVSDLGPLADLSALKSLDLGRTDVGDLEALRNLSALQTLSVWGTAVRDLEPVRGLSALQYLNIAYLEEVIDLEPLKSLTRLRRLSMMFTRVRDLSPLQGLTELRELSLSSTLLEKEAIEDLRAALPDLEIADFVDRDELGPSRIIPRRSHGADEFVE